MLFCFLLKVPQGLPSGAYDSPQPPKCPNCSHHGPIKPNTCHDCHSNRTCPRAEGGVVVRVGHSCSSAHQMSRQGAARCHWLHGSNESGTPKPTQRHMVTVRWDQRRRGVFFKICSFVLWRRVPWEVWYHSQWWGKNNNNAKLKKQTNKLIYYNYYFKGILGWVDIIMKSVTTVLTGKEDSTASLESK